MTKTIPRPNRDLFACFTEDGVAILDLRTDNFRIYAEDMQGKSLKEEMLHIHANPLQSSKHDNFFTVWPYYEYRLLMEILRQTQGRLYMAHCGKNGKTLYKECRENVALS